MGLFDVFRRRDPGLDPAVLQRIADAAARADLRATVELLPFLPPPTSPYGEVAARAVESIVRAASPEDVAAFDAWYRERTCSGSPRPSWENMGMGPLEIWARLHPTTVALATCHRSGFVREKAVEALAECRDGMELPFLLVRLNDWVPRVRFVAGKTVRARLSPDYAAHWVRCHGVLGRVQRGRRSAHDWLKAPRVAPRPRRESRYARSGPSPRLGPGPACVRRDRCGARRRREPPPAGAAGPRSHRERYRRGGALPVSRRRRPSRGPRRDAPRSRRPATQSESRWRRPSEARSPSTRPYIQRSGTKLPSWREGSGTTRRWGAAS